MLSIGAFAQVGQVTHRMLRHWDQVGLLVPAHVDPGTGYRSYDPEQLDRLHRIVALRQLGFGIEEISTLLEDGLDAGDLARMLGRRRHELEREHRIASERLADVERRLHLIEEENAMPAVEIVTKSLPALRLAARTATVRDQPEVAGLVGPAFDAVAAVIGHIPGALETPVASYSLDERGLHVIVGYAYDGEPRDGVEIVSLPAVEKAFCSTHLGEISGIASSWQALHAETVARGAAPSGPCRELYLRADESGRSDEFVVELQQPVRPVD
ncbi:MerR family transcriptional regulator [Nesterenkonia sp. CL21]|uniref:MerR family transcriptional regulator n=1 Tax=Nesterenkonia sp. CL21 TaxID=3064894 RepID=UPI0028793AC9|nr:MerR family transcriptional regulator [Nesterenkonia sp. CL21]MDS2172302.1 MerR family transcriptional regulator [Nesterenkonia sp. CL21]